MDSPQSVVSPLKNSSVFPEPEKRNLDFSGEKPSFMSPGTDEFVGVLEVFIHQARDIHNICIYHKQDVYAKICLTSRPENSVSTQTINGGGQNPVFNQNLRLEIPTVESSLKCEIWMLSRVRNYLEDQLLGFAVVPLSEILIGNGKILEKEFSLSSTDLFHSPAGFVKLSFSYSGALPEVMAIPSLPVSTPTELPDSVTNHELDKIEFPDPKVDTENHMMVSEYFGISSDSLVSSDDTDNQLRATFLDSLSAGGDTMSVPSMKPDSPPSIVSVLSLKPDSPPSIVSVQGSKPESPPSSVSSTNGSTQSSDTPRGSSQWGNREFVSPLKGKTSTENGDSETTTNSFTRPIVSVNIEPEQKVVQQDFVDLYMKSMQQFTESLAKMKLPMDMESDTTSSGNSSSDQKIQTPKSTTRSRVFYGSRAFF